MSGRDAARGRAQGGREVATTAGGPDPASTMRGLLEQMKPELATALPRHMTPERMARQALTAFRTTPNLDKCTPASFLGALMTCAQVGLEPGPQGYVYLVPYRNNRSGNYEATFILGYKGMLELARRSGELLDVSARTIYANEVSPDGEGLFDVEYGTYGKIVHKPILFGDRGDPVGYYATARLRSGAAPFVVLARQDVEKFRKRSATQRDNPSGPWSSDYEPMAWKTCVRRLSTWLPQSPELAAAMSHEETTREVSPGRVTATVIDMQPPAIEEGAADHGPDPSGAGEVPAGTGDAAATQPGPTPPPVEDPPADPWAGSDQAADPSDPDDPWAGKS